MLFKATSTTQKIKRFISIKKALAIILIPLYFPMHFIFYTEIGSVTYCLLIYYYVMVIKKKPYTFLKNLMLVAISVMAFLQRQTNIIWINYIGVLGIINNCGSSSLFSEL